MYDRLDTSEIATGALIFTVAIAWNNATRSIIDHMYPKTDTKSHIAAQLIYAILITIIVIIIMYSYNAVHSIATICIEKINSVPSGQYSKNG